MVDQTNEQEAAGVESVLAGRLPWLSPAELTPEQAAVYEAITSGPRKTTRSISPVANDDGRLEGPFNAMLFSPAVGGALQSVGAAIRYMGCLTGRQREAAILAVAVNESSDFEWLAHVAVGRAEGLTDAELEAIRTSGECPTFSDAERVVVEVVGRLLKSGDLDDETFASADAVLGAAALVETVILVGYYRMLSTNLRVFRMPLPATR